ncbi:long-chain fatty acid--CoA ligase [Acuticoccus sediminis]|uniref:Long-chain fatty acid--CoA ligase n=1 Tax=Acuticoccus sediminis TaxID=2184697 RepID=A0A8B2NK69_9HYPH|nr:AMP-binding protein [Acuticoccus sediminis]RAH96522.1 long-chain fatty acid--CoA ligase [Acuticoccus sediminis]
MTPPGLTLPQMLLRQAGTHPDRVAIRQKDFGIWAPTTWRGYAERAEAVGAGLAAIGLPPEGHVAVLSENRIEWVLSQLGAAMLRAITVGVYPTSPHPEVGYVLEHSDSQIVVCEDQEQVDKVLEERHRLPALKRIVVVETKGMRAYPADLVIAFDALEEMGRAHLAADPAMLRAGLERQSLDDVALMIYTSGSTGRPKGAMLTYRNLRAQAIAATGVLGLTAADTHLSYLPLCHVAEQIVTTMAPIYVGSQVNFGESLRTVQEDLRELAPTIFLGVPRIWEKLHAAIHIRMVEAGGIRKRLYDAALAACASFATVPRERRTAGQRLTAALWYVLVFRGLLQSIGLSRARIAMTGAAPISPRIVAYFRTIGVPLVEVYGATETSGIVLGQRRGTLLAGSVGVPIENAAVRLGEDGEILVKGEVVFAGYYRNEAATAAAVRDGWLHTGDVARVEDGQYLIVDRLKDIMITAGGKNLAPSEIENAMKASPYIKECVVIGEKRRFVAALIQLDFDTVAQWAEEQRLAYTTFRSLAEMPAVRDLIAAEVDAANAAMAPVARVRRFHLLAKELDHDDNEVTATMKVRRANITEKYAEEIERLYRAA